MGFFDLFKTKKSAWEFVSDAVTKGDFSTTKTNWSRVGGTVLGGAAAATKVGAELSHAQSHAQDEAARRKGG